MSTKRPHPATGLLAAAGFLLALGPFAAARAATATPTPAATPNAAAPNAATPDAATPNAATPNAATPKAATPAAATPAAPVLQWTAAAPATSPPPLAYASTAYDSDNHTLVLFGGVSSDGALSDATWVWNGHTWTQPKTSEPPPRELASMAFDPSLHQLILFGGQGANGQLLGDTWAWNGATWYPLDGQGPTPAAREAASLAYDHSGNLVLFGGTGYTPASPSTTSTSLPGVQNNPSTQTVLGDTWQWTSDGWTQSSATGPAARSGAVLAYDPANGTTVLFSGETTTTGDFAPQFVGDTWTWNGSAWTQAKPATSPPGRFAALAGPVAATGPPVVLCGSGASGELGDAWEWSGSDWVQAKVEGGGVQREGAAGAFDAAIGALVVYGGTGGGGGVLPDTDLVTSVATRASATTTTTVPSTPTTVRPSHSTTTVARTTPPTTGRSSVTTAPGPVAFTPALPGSLSILTNSHSIRGGALVHLVGSGFAPGSPVEITFHSTPSLLGWATAGPDGRFAKTVVVPSGAPAGQHHIMATGTAPTGGQNELIAAVLVIGPHHSGISSTTTFFLVGLALLIPVASYLAMAGLGVWRRRRRGLRAS